MEIKQLKIEEKLGQDKNQEELHTFVNWMEMKTKYMQIYVKQWKKVQSKSDF